MKDLSQPSCEEFANLPTVVLAPPQQELLDWFKDNAPSLVDPYKGAVTLLSMHGFPGRIHLICHFVRDICNHLPNFLGEIKRKRTGYDEEIKQLAQVWPESVVTPSSEYVGKDRPEGDERIPIRKMAVQAAANLVRKYKSH